MNAAENLQKSIVPFHFDARIGGLADLEAPGAVPLNASETASGLRVQTARTMAEIEALAPAWTALETQSATPTFFQSAAWCRHVLATLRRAGPAPAAEPIVLAAWRGTRLVAVWPLQITRESGARVLTDLSSPFGQYADIVLAPATEREAAASGESLCRWLIEQARTISGADALVLRKVRVDTPLGRVLADGARPLQTAESAPFVSMAGFASFAAFHASTKAKTRKNVRNATHRLEKLGVVSHRVELRSSGMDAALAACFDLRSTWLEAQGMTSTAFAHPAFSALVAGLADPASHAVEVLTMTLLLDDRPISIHYGFLHNRRYYAYMAARNPDYDACSPGKVHLEHVMAACFAAGADTVDLLGPAMPYKTVWATDSAATEDYGLTWSMRGWFAIDVWRRHARPLGKGLFCALPAGVRQWLIGRGGPAAKPEA